MTAVHTGAGTDVHHMVSGTNGVFVVLDNDQGVAEVAQPLERRQQAVIVTLVQSDARFIQDIENTGESGTDLCGQTDPLRLASRKGHRRPIQAEIVQTHIQQEPQTHADLSQHEVTDLNLTGRQQWLATFRGANPHQLFNPFKGLADTHRRELRDPERTDAHCQSLGPQPLASAAAAGNKLQIFLQLLPLRFTTGITKLPLQDRQNPLKRACVPSTLAVTTVGLNQNRFATAVQQNIALLVTEVLPGRLDLESEGFTHRIEKREVIGVVLLGPGGHCGVHRQRRIGNHPISGEFAQMTDAMAVITGSVGTVEGEQPR